MMSVEPDEDPVGSKRCIVISRPVYSWFILLTSEMSERLLSHDDVHCKLNLLMDGSTKQRIINITNTYT